MKTIFITTFLLITPVLAYAQSESDLLGAGPDDLNEMLDETMSDEESVSTFILDNTKTKIGGDLYETFYHEWSSIQLDTASRRQLKLSLAANPELVIEIEEIPSPGLNNVALIKVDDVTIWQDFAQPRPDALAIQVSEAVRQVIQYFISFQDIQNQLGSQDQSGSGIR